MPTSNRPWRAFFIRWCCCRPRCSGDSRTPEIDAVLAHEHEHIARHDNLKDSVHRLVETLFWFHPAVWWIGRQMIEERERACDEAVLAGGHDGGEYASGILAVCRHCRAGAARIGHGHLRRSHAARALHPRQCDARAALGAVKALSLLVATIAATTVPMFAGAVDGTAHRLRAARHQFARARNRGLFISPAVSGPERARISRRGRDGVAHPQHLAARPDRARLRRGTLAGERQWPMARFAALRHPRRDARPGQRTRRTRPVRASRPDRQTTRVAFRSGDSRQPPMPVALRALRADGGQSHTQ